MATTQLCQQIRLMTTVMIMMTKMVQDRSGILSLYRYNLSWVSQPSCETGAIVILIGWGPVWPGWDVHPYAVWCVGPSSYRSSILLSNRASTKRLILIIHIFNSTTWWKTKYRNVIKHMFPCQRINNGGMNSQWWWGWWQFDGRSKRHEMLICRTEKPDTKDSE